jgi:peptidoglycan/LPS O-acetylase OafA/YrhL
VLFASLTAKSAVASVLNWRWLQLLGVVSYSLYLWQQLFTGAASPEIGWCTQFPPLCILAAALSYQFVERPMMRIGHRLSAAVINTNCARTGMVSGGNLAEPQIDSSRSG